MANRYPRITLAGRSVVNLFTAVGGFTALLQAASTSDPAFWLVSGASGAGLISLVYLVKPFLQETPPNPTDSSLPTPVNKVEAGLAVVAAIGVIATSLALGRQVLPARDVPAPVASVIQQASAQLPTIDRPEGLVGEVECAGGQAGNLRQGETLWVFASNVGSEDGSEDRNFFLQRGPCVIRDDQTWTCPEVWVGAKPGDRAHIWVVRANSRQTEEFVHTWNNPLFWDSDLNTPDPESDERRFVSLPGGVIPCDRPLLATRR
ncbi:hypothetical protein ACQPZA_24210 [Pseudonocardia xinjiangensis]|uniref:hypothetical protein n=1 Tax=Pseudonocardia xinjiangensis TaxID=75289 RepID=UPI003D9443C0